MIFPLKIKIPKRHLSEFFILRIYNPIFGKVLLRNCKVFCTEYSSSTKPYQSYFTILNIPVSQSSKIPISNSSIFTLPFPNVQFSNLHSSISHFPNVQFLLSIPHSSNFPISQSSNYSLFQLSNSPISKLSIIPFFQFPNIPIPKP
jgi:hypothetical protein